MPTYYKQHRRTRKDMRRRLLGLIASHNLDVRAQSQQPRPRKSFHHAGIPEFEFRTPDNPNIVQDELIRFTDRACSEETPIGYDFQKHKERFPFPIARELQMDRAADKAAGFNNFRSFPHDALDFTIKPCKVNSHGLQKPRGIDWQDDCAENAVVLKRDSNPLDFIDRLALGDARAGHLLYLLEQELGSFRIE